jgi:hypothetical protein
VQDDLVCGGELADSFGRTVDDQLVLSNGANSVAGGLEQVLEAGRSPDCALR